MACAVFKRVRERYECIKTISRSLEKNEVDVQDKVELDEVCVVERELSMLPRVDVLL